MSRVTVGLGPERSISLPSHGPRGGVDICGIAGHVGPRQIQPEVIDRCLRQMRHRGPDGEGASRLTTAAGMRVDLLATRLRIIDLDPRGDQPMSFGPHTIVYNGELYNYIELRNALTRAGVAFETATDTEVVLRAIATDGWGALDRFEGMWAFALYDERDGSLTLCRDRFGEKPLYVLSDGADVYFGSEIKLIQTLLGRPLVVDEDHLLRYLVHGYKALYKKDRQFFVGVRSIPPGTYLRLSTAKAVRYWTPALEQTEMTYEAAVAGTRDRLMRAVELRLRADVPLAFCMSGGIDSNALISIAKRTFGYDVHGFTIVNTDARYDEQDMVNASVRELGIRHTAIPLSVVDFPRQLRQLVRQHDAPVSTITYYTHWLLMRSIADHGYRISISGTAADELFTGYYDHHLQYLQVVRDDHERARSARRAWEEHVRPFVRNPLLQDPDRFVREPGFRQHIFLDVDHFVSYLRRPWHEPFEEGRWTGDLLRDRMLNELFHENVPVILHEDDLNAMAYSIENRSPYLDRELFTYAFSIPTRHLVRGGYAKAVLRDAVRGIAPDVIVDNRRKVGFNAPIFALLDRTDPRVRAGLLDESPIYRYVRRDRIAALLDREDLPNSESKFLFSFINAKMFLEEFEH